MINELINLNESPLFAMSQGSMELFHSNFWCWLMKLNSKYIRAFFNENEISDEELHMIKTKDIRREYKHTDIAIILNNKVFIIENKIKTLPNENQLLAYQSTFKNQFKKGKYLNITTQKILNINTNDWESLSYNNILESIELITEDIKDVISSDNHTIINSYINMTRNVISLITNAISSLHLDTNLLISSKKNKLLLDLKEIKMDDIIKKINGSILFERLIKELTPYFSDNDYYYQLGYNHKNITISIRRKIVLDSNKYILLGPQLEGNTFRRTIHVTNNSFQIKKSINDINELYKSLDEVYFSDDKYMYPIYSSNESKKYNEYKGIYGDKNNKLSKEEYIALYRYLKLDEIFSNQDIHFDMIIELFKKELEYVKGLDTNVLVSKVSKEK